MRLLTGRAAAGVSVLVADDQQERAIVQACLGTRNGARVEPWPAGSPPRLLCLDLGDGLRDEVLVVDRGPKGLELHLHGGKAVLGAFERRFGALDEPAAECVLRPAAEALLRDCLGREQLVLAIEQRELSFADWVASAPSPEDVRMVADRSHIAAAMVSPQRLVLAGRQNAGKSSLFNRLLFRRRALTGDLPGLTRDLVIERVVLGGYPYELVDTAGEGQVCDAVDHESLRRARDARETGLAVLVVDGARGVSAVDRALFGQLSERLSGGPVVVHSRADRVAVGPAAAGGPGPESPDARFDCSDPAQAAEIRRAMGKLLRERRGLPPAGAVGGLCALDPSERSQLADLVAAGQ